MSFNLSGPSPADLIVHPVEAVTHPLQPSASEPRSLSQAIGNFGAYAVPRSDKIAEHSTSPPPINLLSRNSAGGNEHSSVSKPSARRSLSLTPNEPPLPPQTTPSPKADGSVSPNRRRLWRLSTDIKGRIVTSASAGLTVPYRFVPSFTAGMSMPDEDEVVLPTSPSNPNMSAKAVVERKEKRLSLLDKMRMRITHTERSAPSAEDKEREDKQAQRKANKHALKELRDAEKKAIKDWAKDKDRGQLRVIALEDHEEKDQLVFKRGDVIAVNSLPSSDSADALAYGTVLGLTPQPQPFPPRAVALLSDDDPLGDFQLLSALLGRPDYLLLNAIAHVANQLDAFEDVLTALLVYLELQGAALTYCATSALKYEVGTNSEVHTLFRSNSFHCSFIALYAKRISEEYLGWLIKPTVQAVVASTKSYEINPSALGEGETVEGNLRDLTTQVSELIHQITASVRTFVPTQLAVLSRELHLAVERRWPGVGFSILTAFLFLRVFCPAVIVPELLVGMDVPQDRKRALVLVSKALQAVANGETQQATSYMSVLNPFIAELQPRLRTFAEEIVATPASLQISSSIHCADPDELRREALTFVGGFLHTHLRKVEENIAHAQRLSPVGFSSDPVPAVREVARRAMRMKERKRPPPPKQSDKPDVS